VSTALASRWLDWDNFPWDVNPKCDPQMLMLCDAAATAHMTLALGLAAGFKRSAGM
jgi:hypothetical protein